MNYGVSLNETAGRLKDSPIGFPIHVWVTAADHESSVRVGFSGIAGRVGYEQEARD